MSLEASLKQAHKERMARINAKAFVPPPVISAPEPEPIPEPEPVIALPPPRSLIQWLQGCWSAIRIFTARKCVNTSTRLIFFARWLAPELWEGQK